MDVECITIDDSSDEVVILETVSKTEDRKGDLKSTKSESSVSQSVSSSCIPEIKSSRLQSPVFQPNRNEMKLEVEITRIVKMDVDSSSRSRIKVTEVCTVDPSLSPDVIVLNESESSHSEDRDDGEVMFLGEFKASTQPPPSPVSLQPKPTKVPKKEIDLCEESLACEGEGPSNEGVDKSEENKEAFHQLCMLVLTAKEGCADLKKAHDKLRKYFENAAIEVLESEELFELLSKGIDSVQQFSKGQQDLLSTINHIKEVLHCLGQDNALVNKKVAKLEKMLTKINKRILKLEEMEVDSEDDGSAYVQLDRHRQRAVEIHNKICALLNAPTDAERATLKKLSLSDKEVPLSIQRALEKYYNRTKRFPDYSDVFKIVQYVNKKECLNYSIPEEEAIAKRMFMEIGESLQRRRKYDDYIIMSEYLHNDLEDPADKDPELLSKLMSNKANYIKKEREVLDKYAREQEKRAVLKSKKNEVEGKEAKESKSEKEDETGEETSEEGSGRSSDEESISHDALDGLMVEEEEGGLTPIEEETEDEEDAPSTSSDNDKVDISSPSSKRQRTE